MLLVGLPVASRSVRHVLPIFRHAFGTVGTRERDVHVGFPTRVADARPFRVLCAQVYPDWRMDGTFVIEQHQTALAYDQTPRRPITASVRSPAEIDDAFYDRTHEKAAAFLRMLMYTTNETVFRRSLARYLERNK